MWCSQIARPKTIVKIINTQASYLVFEIRNTSTTVTQVQQQRPDSPTVTLIRHACKYKVHKLHQSCIIQMLFIVKRTENARRLSIVQRKRSKVINCPTTTHLLTFRKYRVLLLLLFSVVVFLNRNSYCTSSYRV